MGHILKINIFVLVHAFMNKKVASSKVWWDPLVELTRNNQHSRKQTELLMIHSLPSALPFKDLPGQPTREINGLRQYETCCGLLMFITVFR